MVVPNDGRMVSAVVPCRSNCGGVYVLVAIGDVSPRGIGSSSACVYVSWVGSWESNVPYEWVACSASVAAVVSVSSGEYVCCGGCVSFSGRESAHSCSFLVPIPSLLNMARSLASTVASVRYSPCSERKNYLHRCSSSDVSSVMRLPFRL
jgi:hypothetical protein